jgi:urease accessory protein
MKKVQRMNARNLLAGLRFIDSFFPSGGYAYSSGLETAVSEGAVRDADDLSRYVTDLLRHSIGTREAVAVAMAYDSQSDGRLSTALAIDRELDGMLWSSEARQASKRMGRQILRFAPVEHGDRSILDEFGSMAMADRTPGHLAVSLGLTLRACGWTRETAVAGFLYQNAVGFVSAALKLLPIGQRDGQRLLAQWTPLIEELSERAQPMATLHAWAPIQDIYAMRHSRLESRLFRS